MHYATGREAKEGDPVVGKSWNGAVVVGNIVDLNQHSDTCNAMLVRTYGPCLTVNVKDLYHAEDALAAISPKASAVVTPPPTPA